jgi:hypothetical protein
VSHGRLGKQELFQLDQLALFATHKQLAVIVQNSQTRRVVAPVFEAA